MPSRSATEKSNSWMIMPPLVATFFMVAQQVSVPLSGVTARC
jgi:hypothetical protein